MFKFTRFFSIILIFGIFLIFSVSAQQQTVWTRDALRIIYTQFLQNEGYVPLTDKDGDILFKVSGNNYFIIMGKDENVTVNDSNPLFLRIYRGVGLGSFSLQDARVVANNLNMGINVVKIYISSEERRSAAINAELLLTNPQDFKIVLPRTLSLMMFAENEFYSELGKRTSTQ